jgi:hypothetical protein
MNQDQRRPRRPAASARPNLNSTTSIVVAVAAVILGFLILRDINGDNSSSVNPTDGGVAQPTDDVASTDSVPAETTVDTTIPLTNFKVQIANASKVPGSAGELTTAMQGRGFIVQPATNASEITPKQTQTVVYFIPGSEVAAARVAAELGGVTTAAMPAPIPTESGELGEATVLILLGTDLAGKPLAAPVSG